MLKKVLAKILLGVWFINLIILVLILFTRLEINPHRIIYLQLIILFTGISFKLGFSKKYKYSKIVGALVLIIFSSLTIYYSVFLDWRGPWKTQTIIYQNKHISNRTIEFQLQGKGSLGYNRRTVDKIKIVPFLHWIKVLNNEEIDSLTWKKVDIYFNEMNLKGG